MCCSAGQRREPQSAAQIIFPSYLSPHFMGLRQLQRIGTSKMEDRGSLVERIWQRGDDVVDRWRSGLVVPGDAITFVLQLIGQPVQSKLAQRCLLRDDVQLITRCDQR